MKRCYKCNEEKELIEFSRNRTRKDGLNGMCRACKNDYTKNHYGDNKKYYIDKARKSTAKYRKAHREFLWDYLSDHPCIDCGESDPVVLELDHKDSERKVAGVGTLITSWSYGLDKIKAEVLKCDVRCCNCHRRKTAKQFNWWTIDASVSALASNQ